MNYHRTSTAILYLDRSVADQCYVAGAWARLRGGRPYAGGAPGGGPLLRRMGSRPFSGADSTGLPRAPRVPVQGSPRGCLVGSLPNRATPDSDW